MSNELELTDNEKRVIKNQFFPQTATTEEIRFCMAIANQFGLNPLLNQIFFVPRKSKVNGQWIEKVSPLVGRDGFLTIAHKSGKFAGIETTTTIKKVPVFSNGEWNEERDLVGICKVYRTDTERPFIVEVSFKEYAQKTFQGDLTKFWKEKPITQIKKVAESQCLRKAFNVSGIYAEEELNDINPVIKSEEVVAPVEDNVTALLTEDMSNQNVNVVSGEVTENEVDLLEEIEVETIHENQGVLELDV